MTDERRTFELPESCRTVWVSDLHLGDADADPTGLCELIHKLRFNVLYIVGDLFDTRALTRLTALPDLHAELLLEVFGLSERGVRVVYVPGNHDEGMIKLSGGFGHIEIVHDDIYISLDHRRWWIMHGHELDVITQRHGWITRWGRIGFAPVKVLSRTIERVQRSMGFRGGSLSGFIKRNVKRSFARISRFEDAVQSCAEESGCDGVICGHLHWPAVKTLGCITYCNTGDWVEHRSALIETFDGRIQLIQFGQGNWSLLAESQVVGLQSA